MNQVCMTRVSPGFITVTCTEGAILAIALRNPSPASPLM
jgi:hypothetical protein